MDADDTRVDRLIDAIELLRENRRSEARQVLQLLVREYDDFEAAWMWMSVAVDSLEQSAFCLDNVLRVNPKNHEAFYALYRIRNNEIDFERRRARLKLYRDLSLGAMWLLILYLLSTMFVLFK